MIEDRIKYLGEFGDKASALNLHWSGEHTVDNRQCHGLALCWSCKRLAIGLQDEYERGIKDATSPAVLWRVDK